MSVDRCVIGCGHRPMVRDLIGFLGDRDVEVIDKACWQVASAREWDSLTGVQLMVTSGSLVTFVDAELCNVEPDTWEDDICIEISDRLGHATRPGRQWMVRLRTPPLHSDVLAVENGLLASQEGTLLFIEGDGVYSAERERLFKMM